jgi:hypothetical protein
VSVRVSVSQSDWSAWVQAGSSVVIVVFTVLLYLLNRSVAKSNQTMAQANEEMADANQAMVAEMKRTNDWNVEQTTKLLRRQAARFEVSMDHYSALDGNRGWLMTYKVRNVGGGPGHFVTLSGLEPGFGVIWMGQAREAIAVDNTAYVSIEVETGASVKPNFELEEIIFEDRDGTMWRQAVDHGFARATEPYVRPRVVVGKASDKLLDPP